MPVDGFTSHLLTESDGSRANDFYTTADGSKVYNEGQRKLDVCTLYGQHRRSMTFQVARVKKGTSSFLIKIPMEKTRLASRTKEPMRKYGCDRKKVCTSWT